MKTVFAVIIAAMLAGCASTDTQGVQVSYAQSCAAYGAAFATALELRKAGKLNASQIDLVSLVDSQVTPICTGPLPADLDAAAVQVTSAVTTLAIVETAAKGK